MDVRNYIDSYVSDLKKVLEVMSIESILNVVHVMHSAHQNNQRIFVMGNGGSAAIGSHFAADIAKGTLERLYDFNEKRYKISSLTDNVALMTAYANDLSFEDIFVQQLHNTLEEGDVVIAISGSGNSPNLLRAVNYANGAGAITVGILGFMTGGKLGGIVHHKIVVPSNHYGIIEGLHGDIGHIIAATLAKMKQTSDHKISHELDRGGRAEQTKNVVGMF